MQVGGRLPSTSGLIGGAYIKAYNDVYLLMMASWTFGLGEKKRFDALSTETKSLVMEWWTMDTTISPNPKKVCKKRIGVRKFVEYPTHFLQVWQVNIFNNFICSCSLLQIFQLSCK
jgi:hypothetical protein